LAIKPPEPIQAILNLTPPGPFTPHPNNVLTADDAEEPHPTQQERRSTTRRGGDAAAPLAGLEVGVGSWVTAEFPSVAELVSGT
jgi:hypothetical protein